MLTRATLGLGFLMTATGLAVSAALGSLALRPPGADAGIHLPAVRPMIDALAPMVDDVKPAAVGFGSYSLTHRLERGETLGGLLHGIGIAGDDVRAAIEALRSEFDPRRMRAGQELKITLAGLDLGIDRQSIEGLEFDIEFPYRVVVRRAPDGAFEASRDERPVSRLATEAAGVIESSLFEAGAAAGVPNAVLAEMIRMFSWDVDFQRDIQPGDRFAVLYDHYVDDAGETLKAGDIAAAVLVLGGKARTIYRFAGADGRAEYYTAAGRTARKALLRTPIDGARLSSRFGMRRHPILGYSKMHKGVDFAAPTGTPIFAAGDGEVEFAGRRGGYGNYVRIGHSSGYSTAYAHLSRYARGLRTGRRVAQGEVIGYVGSTGRSTGPHLHYEILKGGRQINPLTVKTLPGRQLAGAELERFRAHVAAASARLTAVLEGEVPTVLATARE